MELHDDKILLFWQWFVKNEGTIKEAIENENSLHREMVVENFNQHILGLGVLTWDVGLDDGQNWFLTLSPNGNKDMLKVSQNIMALAPEHMDWLFHSSKPAKNWNRQFTVYDSYMDEQFIDASEWQYIVFEEDDGKLEIVLEAKNIPSFDPEVLVSAAEQFLIQEIGEAFFMLCISSVELVPVIDLEFESSKYHVSELKDHLAEIH